MSMNTPTNSSQTLSNNQSLMSLSELGEKHISQKQEENFELLQQVKEAKADLFVLVEKARCYSKNTGIHYKDTITPPSKKKGYQKSPFGENLHLTDYSYFCSPITKTKNSK